MNTYPTISVVMSTFNREQYLEESINSILNQTFQDFEFIIVDDGSTDNTQKILSKYKDHPKIHILRNSTNLGLAASRNKAIDIAKGYWIAFQDDDDISHPKRLELQFKYLNAHPEIKLLGSRAEFTDNNLNTFAFWDVPETHEEIKRLIKWESPFCHPAVVFQTDSIRLIGKYRVKLNLVEDYDLWLRSVEKFKTHNLPEYLVKVRRHKRSVSVTYLDEQIALHVLAYIFAEQRKLTGKDRYDEMPMSGFVTYLKNTYPQYTSFFEELRKKKYKAFLYEARKSRDWEKGIYFSMKLAKSYPLDPKWIKEIAFFTKSYTRSFLNRHLLWRINKFRSQ